MKLRGDFEANVDRIVAFDVLTNPRQFAPALPQYHSLRETRRRNDGAVVSVKVGKKGMFGLATTRLILQESQPPARLRYTGSGRFIGGTYRLLADLCLEESTSGGTRIYWVGEIKFRNLILDTFRGVNLGEYMESEIELAVSNLRSLLEDMSVAPIDGVY